VPVSSPSYLLTLPAQSRNPTIDKQTGRHEELVASGGVYAQLVRRQLMGGGSASAASLPLLAAASGQVGARETRACSCSSLTARLCEHDVGQRMVARLVGASCCVSDMDFNLRCQTLRG
jgi:hypothetical protein